MSSRWSKRRHLRKIVQATESDILLKFQETVRPKQDVAEGPVGSEHSGLVTDEPCPVFDNTEFAGPGSDESAGPVSEMPGSQIVNCTGLHSFPVESPHRSAASESDDCNSDGNDTPTHDFLEQSLRYWATTFSVSLVALTALLSILRVFHP